MVQRQTEKGADAAQLPSGSDALNLKAQEGSGGKVKNTHQIREML